MEVLNDFHYAYILLDQLYGVEMRDTDFEEVGLIAWNYIGNKRLRIYKAMADVNCEDGSVMIPCNAEIIDAVTGCYEDYQYTTNYTEFDNYDSSFTENYIEARKTNKHPLYASGRFIKYYESGDTIYVDKNLRKVRILYRGTEADDDGLPKLTDKEAMAIATYVAYIQTQKQGYITRNKDLIALADRLRQDWEKKCDAARVKSSVWSQNDMDKILDAKSNWNRKMFGKSYKPFK